MARKWIQSVDVDVDEAGQPTFEAALAALAGCIEDGRLKVSTSEKRIAFIATVPAERWFDWEDEILSDSQKAILRDDDSGFNDANDRYVVKRAGLWMFGVSGSLWSDGGSIGGGIAGAGVLIKANIGGNEKLLVAASGQVSDFEGGSFCFANVSGSGIRDLALNDEVYFRSHGGDIYTHSGLILWGLYLGT